MPQPNVATGNELVFPPSLDKVIGAESSTTTIKALQGPPPPGKRSVLRIAQRGPRVDSLHIRRLVMQAIVLNSPQCVVVKRWYEEKPSKQSVQPVAGCQAAVRRIVPKNEERRGHRPGKNRKEKLEPKGLRHDGHDGSSQEHYVVEHEHANGY